MKVYFKNFGYVANGVIETGKLTIICGKNNTGKTYLSHAIYGINRFISQTPLFFRWEEK